MRNQFNGKVDYKVLEAMKKTKSAKIIDQGIKVAVKNTTVEPKIDRKNRTISLKKEPFDRLIKFARDNDTTASRIIEDMIDRFLEQVAPGKNRN